MSDKLLKKEISDLDNLISKMDKIRIETQDRSRVVQRKILAEPWPVFIRRMRLLSPQAWGGRVESYLRSLHGWKKVDPSLEMGDAMELTIGAGGETAERYFEMKTSIITPTNTGVNFVQIRPHHDIDGYHLFVVQQDYSLMHYYLDKKQMQEELNLIGSRAHGVLKNQRNQDVEWAVRFEWDKKSPILKRWETYLVSKGEPDSVCCKKGD